MSEKLFYIDINNFLPGGVGIEVCTHIFDLKLKFGLGPLRGSLEGHVLQEVCNTVVRCILVPSMYQKYYIPPKEKNESSIIKINYLIFMKRRKFFVTEI